MPIFGNSDQFDDVFVQFCSAAARIDSVKRCSIVCRPSGATICARLCLGETPCPIIRERRAVGSSSSASVRPRRPPRSLPVMARRRARQRQPRHDRRAADRSIRWPPPADLVSIIVQHIYEVRSTPSTPPGTSSRCWRRTCRKVSRTASSHHPAAQGRGLHNGREMDLRTSSPR